MDHPIQPTTPPRTPRRGDQSHSTSRNSTTVLQETTKRPKARNKKRPSDVVTSPCITLDDRSTPPLTGLQSAGVPSSSKAPNMPSTAAYAGPTFHASPAPSALPIPSFYSKSVPDSPGLKSLQKLGDVSLPNGSDSPTKSVPNLAEQVDREESPLDFIFKAHREEKARARSASSCQDTATGPFPPPPGQPRQNLTPSTLANIHRSRQGSSNRASASGIFAMELDGPQSPGQPLGPAFSTPYAERISAARGQSSSHRSIQASPDLQQPLDRSAALKAYLFSPPCSTSSQTSSPNEQHQQINTFRNDFTTSEEMKPKSGRSSGLRKEISYTSASSPPANTVPSAFSVNSSDAFIDSFHQPPTPLQLTSSSSVSHPTSPFGASPKTKTPDVKGMEDNLRKILKLDSAGRA